MFRTVFALGFCICLLGSATVDAASLYIDPATSTLNRSDAATFAIRIDTDEAADECINAADVVLSYGEAVVPVDVSTGNSIFSVWVERPTIDTESRTVTFAGGIPNGYCGRISGDPNLTNILAEVVVRSPGLRIGASDAEAATLAFGPETTVYANDGFGTKVPLTTYGSEITLTPRPGGSVQDPWRETVRADRTPPAEFSIDLERDERAFGGKYFITFSTTDKETGIDRYEVMEEPLEDGFTFRWGAADAPWVRAESPYVLGDQSLNSTIRVRAIDKAGNEYVATLIPEESLRSMTRAELYTYIALAAGAIMLGIILITIILVVRRWRSRRSMRGAAAAADGSTESAAVDDASEEDEDEEYDDEEDDDMEEYSEEVEEDDEEYDEDEVDVDDAYDEEEDEVEEEEDEDDEVDDEEEEVSAPARRRSPRRRSNR